MLHVKIISVGRPKERWIEEGVEEYARRLQSTVDLDFVWVKQDEQLVSSLAKESQVVCLDPSGKMMASEEFSRYFYAKIQGGGSRLAFAIGGAEGLPAQIREQYDMLSLSPMTFTHQLTRLVLVEQIYRSVEIVKGTGYHK